MSRIEELIKEKCPNGVEYKKLGEFCEIKTGAGITKKDIVENGKYKIISGGYEPMGLCDKKNRNKDTVTIARAGSAGFVNYLNEDFYLNDKCFSIIPNSIHMNNKYLYYALKTIQNEIFELKSSGTVPTVNTEKVSRINVPIPPIEVQEEIVKILDKFGKLEAELEAELEARKSQYEFWRGNLLNKENNIVKISEITNSVSSGRCSSRSETGEYPVYGSTGIIAKTDSYVYETEKVLIARVGANAGFVHIATGKYDVTDNTLILDLKDNVNMRYIYYYLQNYNLNKIAKGGGQPLITGGQIKDLEINLPSLEEQEKIVNILDKFDKLVNDISEGLPAEIEARRKQYEYYRNKLLSFEEVEVNE